MKDLACASIEGELHCVRLDKTGRICHCIRGVNGGWSEWGRLFPQDFISIDIASIGRELHILALSGEGIVFHSIRFEDGKWQDIVALQNQGYGGKF